MITYDYSELVSQDLIAGNREGMKAKLTLYGTSEDTKPTQTEFGVILMNGSRFIEVDTGDAYIFDEENEEWNYDPEGGGGGSSVSFQQILSSGTEIGIITINGVRTSIFAPEGGSAQEQADWNQSDTTAVDYIKNKPSDVISDANYVHTDNNFTTDLKTKLDSVDPAPIDDTQESVSKTYSSNKILELINAIEAGLQKEIVNALPVEDINPNILYMVPKQDAGTDDIYDEYIYLDTASPARWEKIGTTQVDLSNFYTKSETTNLLANKVDKVSGKGLSTNDYTTEEKTKLSDLKNIQVSLLPTATDENVDTIYEYIGPTGSGLKNGYFYKCVAGPSVDHTIPALTSTMDNRMIYGNDAESITRNQSSWDNRVYKAFDGNASTYVDGLYLGDMLTNANGYYMWDYTQKVKLKHIYISVSSDSGFGNYTTLELYGSNDKTNFELCASLPLGTAKVIDTDITSNNKTYRYWKMRFHGSVPYTTVGRVYTIQLTTTAVASYSWEEIPVSDDAITSVKVNGTAQTISNKAVDISVPTKTSDLTNDSNYVKTSDISTVATTGDFDDLDDRPESSSNIDMSEICMPLPSNATDGVIYSTTERKIGRWIDGKPLYQKTLTYDNTLDNNHTYLATEIAALGSDYISFTDVNFYETSVPSWQSPYFVSASDKLQYIASKSGIFVMCAGRTYTKLRATVQYTKTTD